jgi:LPS O-antigen subunit length determinant protein (WzzB/FepE family)
VTAAFGAQEAQQHFRGLWSPVMVVIVLAMLGRAVAISSTMLSSRSLWPW